MNNPRDGFRIFMAVLIAVAVCGGISACSSDSLVAAEPTATAATPSTEATTPTTEAETPTTEAATPSAEAAVAVTTGKVRLRYENSKKPTECQVQVTTDNGSTKWITVKCSLLTEIWQLSLPRMPGGATGSGVISGKIDKGTQLSVDKVNGKIRIIGLAD